MTVNVQPVNVCVNSNNLLGIFFQREFVRGLARQLVANQVEAHIEMLDDFGNDYKDFAAVLPAITGAKDVMEDVISDILTEFRDSLYSAVEDVQIEVTNATFNAAGFVDATAEITSKA